ncbi:Hypothetical predicted protein [Podarcis lilfordi]|uniref:Uncharacterized protein n=1 Tax=Podarcis lilfordi TaxID=74358 RepID=A0AA35LKL2_9SAUR|nr:Hypothetical predicted protein [Podarcis lilfordi]
MEELPAVMGSLGSPAALERRASPRSRRTPAPSNERPGRKGHAASPGKREKKPPAEAEAARGQRKGEASAASGEKRRQRRSAVRKGSPSGGARERTAFGACALPAALAGDLPSEREERGRQTGARQVRKM